MAISSFCLTNCISITMTHMRTNQDTCSGAIMKNQSKIQSHLIKIPVKSKNLVFRFTGLPFPYAGRI